ncbi:MAG: trigger factor, partial [Myxococcota bacterium]
MMDVNLEKTGSYGRKLSITLPADEVNKAFDRAYKTIAKSARIPGFRPGKAPRNVIEMHYGEQMRSEVEQSLVSSSLLQALQQSEETPVAMPSVDPGALKRGNEFSYTAEFEVPPEVKLEKHEGLAIERLELDVPESDVENELEQMREQAAQLVPVMVREETQKGDIVTMDYEGFIDDVAFPGGTGENAMIEIGGGDYIPGFSEGIEGAKVGATVSFPVTFPEDYGAQELAGKTATFKVTVKEIKTKELPALDDDFAKDVGEDSLDALKGKIREQIEGRKKREIEDEQRTLVLKALVEANEFEVPPTMIRQQAERMVQNAAERMKQIMVGGTSNSFASTSAFS